MYDISVKRIKAFDINVDPRGVEYYKQRKLDGAVPQAIINLFGR